MLETFHNELLRWNKHINLVSKNDEKVILERHINDCLQLNDILDLNSKIVDVGSGGGFPGIILAISGFKEVILIERDQKKCAFLSYIKSLLKLNNAEIICDDISNISLDCDVVTSRGLFSVQELIKKEKLRSKTYVLFKGANFAEDLENINYKVYKSKCHEGGKIILINK